MLVFIRSDSHLPSTVTSVRELFRGREVDFLFVDGDHSYDGVRQDYELYGPLVRRGGLIAFHDIMPSQPTIGIPRLWRELEAEHETQRLLKHEGQSGKGIGVLRVR